MMTRVVFVIASYSDLLARGIVGLAEQMAPNVVFKAAGDTEDGGIGIPYGEIEATVNPALETVGIEAGSGVVVLVGLRSALTTVKTMLDFADGLEHIVSVDTPVAEVTVATSIEAQFDDSLGNVVAVARDVYKLAVEEVEDFGPRPGPAIRGDKPMTVSVLVADLVGLHARPVAPVARVTGSFNAEVTLSSANAALVLELMALGVAQGQRVGLSVLDPEAVQALGAFMKATEEVE